jgi:hypothetical protein
MMWKYPNMFSFALLSSSKANCAVLCCCICMSVLIQELHFVGGPEAFELFMPQHYLIMFQSAPSSS